MRLILTREVLGVRNGSRMSDIAVVVYALGRQAAKCVAVFFFFQAEDGIRDLTVTGVQTCALPISAREAALAIPGYRRATARGRGCQRTRAIPPSARRRAIGSRRGRRARTRPRRRSEERRVGKEGKSRWWPYH